MYLRKKRQQHPSVDSTQDVRAEVAEIEALKERAKESIDHLDAVVDELIAVLRGRIDNDGR